MAFFILAVTAVICFRLYSLQVSAHASYQALAEGQHTLYRKLIPQRGEIYMQDRNGKYPAAVNKAATMAFAVPKEIENVNDAVTNISNILQLDRGELFEKFSKHEDMYEPLKHRLSDEEIRQLENADIKGIRLAEESYRYYPSNELAANVLGFVGWKEDDFGGRYGLEAYFNEKLAGHAGEVTQDRDASGRWISTGERAIISARDGDNLVLTLDHIIQYEAEKLLKSAVTKHQADSGSIIVMDPQTGKILAMANYPTFNPNEYSKVEDINYFKNTSVNEAYESGSVFKTFTLAAGLDSGLISPDTTYIDTGQVYEAGYTIKNSDEKAYGKQTMTELLEKSLNTGVIHVEKMLGNKNFADYVKRFGFGDLSGIDLIGETAGNINNLKNLRINVQFYTAAFGQGITVTPLQLIAAYSAIANGGRLMKPQIIDRIEHSDGTEEIVAPSEIRRVISQKAAGQVAQMLRNVIVNGHGKRANVPGYLVAGKTGTAQVASSEKKGYEEGMHIGSFAGFAPIDDPKYAVIVKIDNPRDVEWAESSAAPTFGELMKFLLEYGNGEPTEEYDQKDLNEFDATHNLKEFFLKQMEEEKEMKEKEDKKDEKDDDKQT